LDLEAGLARALFRQNRFADAVALCDSLIAGQPDNADLWLLQASAYIGLGQPLRAAENLELVDRLGRSTADSLNNLGDIYVNEGLFDLAVDSYLRAMDADPQAIPRRAIRAAKVLSLRGGASETKELIERIEAEHGEQLDLEDRKDLLGLRARLAVAEGEGAEEEVRILEQVVELDPLDGEALMLLGNHSSAAGDIEKAVFYYERAANLEKFEADAKVLHAQVLVKQGKYVEALPLLRRAQLLQPRDKIQDYLEEVERASVTR
jgi:tetratricopeptide (TPR) repeat protein